MPLNSKIVVPFAPVEPPKSKYESTLTMLEFNKKGVQDKSLKRDTGKPPKHLYEHTVEVPRAFFFIAFERGEVGRRWRSCRQGEVQEEVSRERRKRLSGALSELLPCSLGSSRG